MKERFGLLEGCSVLWEIPRQAWYDGMGRGLTLGRGNGMESQVYSDRIS